MIRYDLLDRDLSRLEWTLFYRVFRKHGQRGSILDDSELGERERIAASIARMSIDGRIGVVESGMDCDCVRYCHGRIHSGLTAIRFQRLRDDTYAWADGPCCVSLCEPDQMPESYSRDLALEAFEDGHPHVVYA